jgi:hypothetical protein
LGANGPPLVPLDPRFRPLDAAFSQVTDDAAACSRFRFQPVRVRIPPAPQHLTSRNGRNKIAKLDHWVRVRLNVVAGTRAKVTTLGLGPGVRSPPTHGSLVGSPPRDISIVCDGVLWRLQLRRPSSLSAFGGSERCGSCGDPRPRARRLREASPCLRVVEVRVNPDE